MFISKSLSKCQSNLTWVYYNYVVVAVEAAAFRLCKVAVTVTRGIVTSGAAVTFGIQATFLVAFLVSAEIEAPTLSLSEASFIVTTTACCLSDVACWLPTNVH